MPSGGHNRKRKRAPRRNARGYTCIQCECCRRPFASNHALINHRSFSRPCYDRYFFSSVTNVTSENTASASSSIAISGSSGTNTSSNICVRPSSSIRPSSNRRDDNTTIPLVDTVPTATGDETSTEFRDIDEDDDNSDDDKTVEWEESSKSVSSNDDDGNTPSDGIGNLDDLVNGIDNDFDDAPLSTTLNEYNFNDDNSVNNSGTAESDDDSSLAVVIPRCPFPLVVMQLCEH
eukprot:scaffold3293_cov43-Attheya_sp.AAC.1